jgi:hypothetical protein
VARQGLLDRHVRARHAEEFDRSPDVLAGEVVVTPDLFGGVGSHDYSRRIESDPERTVESPVSQREVLEAEVEARSGRDASHAPELEGPPVRGSDSGKTWSGRPTPSG